MRYMKVYGGIGTKIGISYIVKKKNPNSDTGEIVYLTLK